MNKVGFSEALDGIVERDPRYDRESYLFLRDALDYTIKRLKKDQTPNDRHVSPPQLLEGIRVYALKEFGPMAPTVLDYWGIHESLDFGNMVFNLVESGIFGKTENDRVEDFRDVYDFHSAFVIPFLPAAGRAAAMATADVATS